MGDLGLFARMRTGEYPGGSRIEFARLNLTHVLHLWEDSMLL